MLSLCCFNCKSNNHNLDADKVCPYLLSQLSSLFSFYIYLFKLTTQHSSIIISIKIKIYGLSSLLFDRGNSLWRIFVWKWWNMYCYLDCVQRTSTKMLMSAAILWSKVWRWYEKIILNMPHFHLFYFVAPYNLKCHNIEHICICYLW